jgi:hypothetical protein
MAIVIEFIGSQNSYSHIVALMCEEGIRGVSVNDYSNSINWTRCNATELIITNWPIEIADIKIDIMNCHFRGIPRIHLPDLGLSCADSVSLKIGDHESVIQVILPMGSVRSFRISYECCNLNLVGLQSMMTSVWHQCTQHLRKFQLECVMTASDSCLKSLLKNSELYV